MQEGAVVRHARGFTLVELLVVLGIATLLIALAPLAYERMREGVQYRDTVRRIAADLRQARQMAAAQGREVRFVVDLQGRAFGVQDRPALALPESLSLEVVVAGIEMAGQQAAAIRFLPEGGATGGTIGVLRRSGGGTRLTVDWLSGRVTQEPVAP